MGIQENEGIILCNKLAGVHFFVPTLHDLGYNRKKCTFCCTFLAMCLLLRWSLGTFSWVDRKQCWSLCLVSTWHPVPGDTVVLVGDREQCGDCHWLLSTPRFIWPGRSKILGTRFPNWKHSFFQDVYVVLYIKCGKISNVNTEKQPEDAQNNILQIWPRSDNADFYFLPTLFSWPDNPLRCSIFLNTNLCQH